MVAPSTLKMNNKVVLSQNRNAVTFKPMRAQSANVQMLAGPASNSQFRTIGSRQMRGSVIMNATIDVESVAAKPEVEYKPEIFKNEFVKKSDVTKNPFYTLSSIGVEAKNGKLPKIESLQDLLKNSSEYLQERVKKV